MRYTTFALLLAMVAAPSVAEARPHRPPPAWRVVVPAPRVRVYVGPWAVGYVPAPRPGWTWVAGHYNHGGHWIPGYWRPTAVRAGWAWDYTRFSGGRFAALERQARFEGLGVWALACEPPWAWRRQRLEVAF